MAIQELNSVEVTEVSGSLGLPDVGGILLSNIDLSHLLGDVLSIVSHAARTILTGRAIFGL